MTAPSTSTLADLVTSFFTNHLGAERDASGHTVASYRDTFKLLFGHAVQQLGRPVVNLRIEDLDPERILSFLDHLEQARGNCVRTRNARLAAIRSFFAFVVTRDAVLAAQAQRVLAIPFKKTSGKLLGYLDEEEVKAILAEPDRTTAEGRRGYLALALLYDTGARVQELVDLRPADFRLDRMPLVRVKGKGRKQRIVPLLPVTAKLVRNHLAETGRTSDDATPLVRNHRGQPMTRSGVAFLLDKYRRRAAKKTPSLRRESISPHTMRHAKAMHLLQAGVSPVTIKDILGHAHLKTLEIYVQADLEMKRKAIENTPSPVRPAKALPRHKPDLLAWLETL
jgi:site-specific recombinase XerD